MGFSTISIIGCLTFLVAMIVSPALSKRKSSRGIDDLPSSGFLIGEATPVFDCFQPSPGEDWNCTELKALIVKEAIDDWRPTKSASEWSEILQQKNSDWKKRHDYPSKTIEANSSAVQRDLHVIVAMDYPNMWPFWVDDKSGYINHKIVYGVAFWDAIHTRLKTTSNPRLRIRIDGIIVMHWINRKAGMMQTLDQALLTANHHLSRFRRRGEDRVPVDFPRVIFTMTNSNKPAGSERWNFKKFDDQLVGVIYDDVRYYGMTGFSAKNQTMMNLLAQYSTSDLRPNAYHQFGNPIINPPMPGQVTTVNKQCFQSGWEETNYAASDPNWCEKLRCANYKGWPWPRDSDQGRGAIDGSPCDYNKVCLEGECILETNSTFSY